VPKTPAIFTDAGGEGKRNRGQRRRHAETTRFDALAGARAYAGKTRSSRVVRLADARRVIGVPR